MEAKMEAKMIEKNKKNRLNQQGFITVDFLFAIIVTMGLSAILFAISFTLTVVEVTQYTTFSSARAFIASNKDYNDQKNSGRKKYAELIENANSAFANLFSNGWFTVSPSNSLDFRGGQTSDGNTFRKDFTSQTDERTGYTGVSTSFMAPILSMNLPFIGATSQDGPDEFVTHVTTILIRESTWKECMDFIKGRGDELIKLKSGQGAFSSQISEAYKATASSMEDNGC